MKQAVLVINTDGTQEVVEKDLPDNWNDRSVQPLDEITALQLAVVELAEAQTADQTSTELALAELADMIVGGGVS